LNKTLGQSNRSGKFRYFAFLFFPFFTFVLSLRDAQNKVSANIVWLFVIFFTQTMSFVQEGMDNQAYRDYLSYTYELENQVKSDVPAGFRTSDFYVNILTKIIGSFTRNGRFIFLVYGVVFGFFYSRNLQLILSRVKESSNKILLLYIVSLFLIVPFWDINGVRMYTAAHAFFYGLLIYSFKKRNEGVLIAASSILIHFSFIFPVFMLLIGMLIKSKNVVNFLIFTFILSLYFNNLLTIDKSGLLKPIAEFLNLSDSVEGYLSDVSIEHYGERKKTYSFHIILYEQFQKIAIGGMMLHMLLTKKLWMNMFKLVRLTLVTGLLIGIITSILSGLPSINRFNAISFFLLLGSYMVLFSEISGKFKILTYLIVPSILFWLIVKIRIGFDFLTLNTVLGSVMTIFLEDLNQLTLIDFFK
jgi:hypothetical protein